MSELLNLSQQITPEVIWPPIIWRVTAYQGKFALVATNSVGCINYRFQVPVIDQGRRMLIHGFDLIVHESSLE